MKADRQVIIVWSALGIVVLFILANFILGKQSSINTQTAHTNKETAVIQSQIRSAEHIRSTFVKVKAEVATLKTQVPSTPDISNLVAQLAAVSARTGVQLVSVAPSTLNDVSAKGITTIPVAVSVKGSLATVQSFVTTLVSAARTTTVSTIAYTWGQGGAVAAQIQANLYYRSGGLP
jgi:Tfp pilus assembly protein PilO